LSCPVVSALCMPFFICSAIGFYNPPIKISLGVSRGVTIPAPQAYFWGAHSVLAGPLLFAFLTSYVLPFPLSLENPASMFVFYVFGVGFALRLSKHPFFFFFLFKDFSRSLLLSNSGLDAPPLLFFRFFFGRHSSPLRSQVKFFCLTASFPSFSAIFLSYPFQTPLFSPLFARR